VKKLVFIALNCVWFANAQMVNFEDVNFKKAILKAYPTVDTDKDGEISVTEAATLTSIRNLQNYPAISSAKGVETFVNLTELSLTQQALTTIDVSANTKLVTLNLRENQLAGTLDIRTLTNLKTLELNKNSLSGIELPTDGQIETLYANENALSTIDVSKQPKLKRLFLVKNNLAQLNLDGNSLLERLHLDDNQLNSLDLTNLEKLNWMSVNKNGLQTLVTVNNPALKTLLLTDNQLKSLDFQDGKPNNVTLINVSNNVGFNLVKKDCNDKIPTMPEGVTISDNCNLSVQNTTVNTKLFYDARTQTVQSSPNSEYIIYTTTGKAVQMGTTTSGKVSTEGLPKGVYLLKQADKTLRFIR